jgi:cytochrome c-type biogenesis protein CcmE
MSRKGRRLTLIGGALAVIACAVGLALFALRGSVSLFLTPSELAARELAPGARLRIGGLVKEGSVVKRGPGEIGFVVTDATKDIAVDFKGVVPDLFREGQGVVAEGVLDRPGHITADAVLAKHDENYMPREVAQKLKQEGLWQGGAPAPARK